MGETWAVVDDEGAAHEVAVSEGRGSARSWWAATPDVARRSHASARDAVVLVAQACGWPIAEVLAPGQVAKADVREQGETAARRAYAARDEVVAALDETRTLLDGVHAALGPTCADAAHEALPGLVREVVQCDETRAEVAHLEARRGALLAEVDRLMARDRDACVVIEDLRKMLASANADLAAAREECDRLWARADEARAEGAREMREAAAKAADDRASGRGHTQATLFAQGQPDMAFVVGIKGGEATAVADTIRALPLPGGAQ